MRKTNPKNNNSDLVEYSGDELVDDLSILPTSVVANDADDLAMGQLHAENERIPEDTAAIPSTVLDFTACRQRSDNPNYPYRSKLDFVLCALFDADDHLLSLTMKRRTLELVSQMLSKLCKKNLVSVYQRSIGPCGKVKTMSQKYE
ncbi:hypothetical protein INT45_011555 [Circinella minor]|uniref:Uncharacterized protein n=1 Tax=Circinella minor TaxID=1195481 RepID=A0A8H7VQE0_9FUNG|nr:hypothetical protein INT45_011555 [Circinella minor]